MSTTATRDADSWRPFVGSSWAKGDLPTIIESGLMLNGGFKVVYPQKLNEEVLSLLCLAQSPDLGSSTTCKLEKSNVTPRMATVLAAVHATKDIAPCNYDNFYVQAAYGDALIGLLGLDRTENSHLGAELWKFTKNVIMATKTRGFISARLEGIDSALHQRCMEMLPSLDKRQPVAPSPTKLDCWIEDMAWHIVLVKKWLDTGANGFEGRECRPIPSGWREEANRWRKQRGRVTRSHACRRTPEESLALDWMEKESTILKDRFVSPVYGFCSPANPENKTKRGRETDDERCDPDEIPIEPKEEKTKTSGADTRVLRLVADGKHHHKTLRVSVEDADRILSEVFGGTHAHTESIEEVADHGPALNKDGNRLASDATCSVEPSAKPDTSTVDMEDHSSLAVTESPVQAASAAGQANNSSPAALTSISTPQSPARSRGESWPAHLSAEDALKSKEDEPEEHAPGSPVDVGPETSINVHVLAALAEKCEEADATGRQRREIVGEIERMSRSRVETFLRMQRGQQEHELRMHRRVQERYVQDLAYMDARQRQHDNTLAVLLLGPIPSRPDSATEGHKRT